MHYPDPQEYYKAEFEKFKSYTQHVATPQTFPLYDVRIYFDSIYV